MRGCWRTIMHNQLKLSQLQTQASIVVSPKQTHSHASTHNKRQNQTAGEQTTSCAHQCAQATQMPRLASSWARRPSVLSMKLFHCAPSAARAAGPNSRSCCLRSASSCITGGSVPCACATWEGQKGGKGKRRQRVAGGSMLAHCSAAYNAVCLASKQPNHAQLRGWHTITTWPSPATHVFRARPQVLEGGVICCVRGCCSSSEPDGLDQEARLDWIEHGWGWFACV